MGSCTRRHFLLSICILQLLTIIERQVFDFLGYMWAPILSNFFHIIFVIFGFFGAYQFRAKYIVTYSIWNVLWIGWNLFLICFYLSIGILDKNSDILNLGTGSVSWFEINGYGCKPIFPTNITSEDPFRPVRPDRVENCLLDYTRIEIIHAAFQILLSVLGLLGAILIARIFLDEDDRFDFMGGDAKCPQHTVVHPMYVSYSSIPTSSATNTVISPKKLFTNNNSLLDITKSNNKSNTNSLSSFYNNTNNNNINKLNRPDDRRNSNLSFPLNNNRLGDHIHYTELSTEKLFSNNNFDNDIILDDDDVINNNNHNNNNNNNNNDMNEVDKIRLNYNPNFNIINKLNSGSGEVLRKNNNDLESYSLKNLKTFNNNNNNSDDNSTNYGYIPQPYPNVSNKIKSNYTILENSPQSNTHDNPEYLDSLPYRRSIKNIKYHPQQQQQQQQHPDQQIYSNPIDNESMNMNNNEESDKYVIPSYQYNVTRSPNLNRLSSKRRQYNHHQHNSQERSQFVNFYDQIRDAPPGYIENITMHRAKSQDRLSQRRHHHNISNINSPSNNNNNNINNNNNHYYNNNHNHNQNKIRPRSYCSNGSFPEHL